ncbi:ABC transporter substrate-binding protein [Acrocarpospora pleiomorpha]|uniref:ABC transporter substrate-binding protein n=1 Tax=Acrocarpospora pleiomorpha TaxID=90975 RepID=A0A5M3XJ75_9ACTN|nr:ABC transporter substrate-binding protein [Acrocarpospora pleiomorpha]GES20726.1 ABC transporter substrate-binding protein [Acrocarpospora pleiomorpha]
MSPHHFPAHRRLVSSALVLLLAGGLAACADQQPAAAPGGDTLVVDTAFNAKSLDPARMFQPTDFYAESALYDTLLKFKGNDLKAPVPNLAESYEVSDDATAYTFRLREDAVFSDGSPVTAADVVFSYNRLKNVKASPAFLMDGLTVTAQDDHTVVIKAERAVPELPSLLTAPNFGVVNADQVKAQGATDAEGADKSDTAERYLNTASAGSGPYVLEGYSNTSQIALTANPKYWGTKPAWQRVVIRNVTAPQQQLLNVEGGESQIALDLSGRQAQGVDRSAFTVTSDQAPEVLYLAASRAKTSATADPEVLAAIRAGIDYQGLLQVAGPGTVQAAGLVPQTFVGALAPTEAPKYDPELAKELVARSGVTAPKITLDYASDYHRLAGLDYATIAQRIQSDLKKIGIEVTLNPAPTATSLQRYVDGQTELALWSYPPDFTDPANLVAFGPGGFLAKRVHWSEKDAPEAAKLTESALAAKGDARAAAYQAWQRVLNDGGPFLPLLVPTTVTLSSARVTDVARNPITGIDLGAVGKKQS